MKNPSVGMTQSPVQTRWKTKTRWYSFAKSVDSSAFPTNGGHSAALMNIKFQFLNQKRNPFLSESFLDFKVAATGRSDAQGRGPGIVLGEKESEVLTSHPERLLRLFTSSDKVIRSSSKRLPYEKIGLIRRGTCNDENLLVDVFPAKVVRGFLDDSSPDECDTMASVSFPCLSCVVS